MLRSFFVLLLSQSSPRSAHLRPFACSSSEPEKAPGNQKQKTFSFHRFSKNLQNSTFKAASLCKKECCKNQGPNQRVESPGWQQSGVPKRVLLPRAAQLLFKCTAWLAQQKKWFPKWKPKNTSLNSFPTFSTQHMPLQTCLLHENPETFAK